MSLCRRLTHFESNVQGVNVVRSILCNKFDMKDLEEVSVILGIKITRYEKRIYFDQSHYVEKILKKYDYFECKHACIPYDPSVKLFKNIGDIVRKIEYVSIFVSLKYVIDCTKPNMYMSWNGSASLLVDRVMSNDILLK